MWCGNVLSMRVFKIDPKREREKERGERKDEFEWMESSGKK